MTSATDNHTIRQLRTIAAEVATQAAELISSKREELGDIRQFATAKSSSVDPVTIVDTAAEEFIVEELSQLRPEDGFIGEEGADRASTSGVTWIVDPIDGTVNFLYGLPHYAVSIAAAINGEPVAGAVINVASGDLYTAGRGQGALLTRADGSSEELRASGAGDTARALVATGFSYSASRRRQQVDILATMLSEVRDIRRHGSAALDLCALAQGLVDVYYEHGTHAWDYAAGVVIAQEAGAVVTYPALSASGKEFGPVIGYAPGLAGVIDPVLESAGVTRPLPPLD